MSKKNNLLSIGEISKLTDASIYSLRYYERIGIMNPAFIDPETGYRYYSAEQIFFIEIIMFCIELDIPLKELSRFRNSDDVVDFRGLLVYGEEIAKKKMKTLKSGLRLVKEIKTQIDLNAAHQAGIPYDRDFKEKYFYIKQIDGSPDDMGHLAFADVFLDMPYEDSENSVSAEYGILYEYSTSGISRYAFAEVPKDWDLQHMKTIPAGRWHCIQNTESQIEQAPNLFKSYLEGSQTFLAIETIIFTGQYKINHPPTIELRVQVVDNSCNFTSLRNRRL